MPTGDRTGPQGLGPRTGRGEGYCAGHSVPGYMNPRGGGLFGFGRRWGRGREYGGGRGFGSGWRGAYPYVYGTPYYGPAYDPEPTAKEEMGILKEESELLKQQLQDVQDRINTLESAGKQK